VAFTGQIQSAKGKMNMSSPTTLNPAALLADVNRHRITLQATLVPLFGDRFQPAGFPEIGHVIYRAPRQDRTTEDVCIVDSAASMANHLESVCNANPFVLELHEDLAALPHVQCWTGDGERKEPTRLVVTSLSEGHRLASSYFVDEKAKLVVDGKASEESFISRLLAEFGMQNLGTRTHPLPGDWWHVFKMIFRYDPNSLVHGILFPSLGIKIPRMLTAHHEAFGAARVGSSGVKFDKLGKTTSGQPIFAVDEETAREIRATFVLDLSLVRSFGRDDKDGLKERQKVFLLELAFWKIRQLLLAPFRFRSNCDLRLDVLSWIGGDLSNPKEPKDRHIELSDLSTDIAKAMTEAFAEKSERVTKVYWPSEELFRPGRDIEEKPADDTGEDAADSDDAEASG
jgi:CRISPR-associated protein Csb1